MKQYTATLKADSGKHKLTVLAENEQTAIDMICKAERCPERAIIKLTVKPIPEQGSRKAIKDKAHAYILNAIDAEGYDYDNSLMKDEEKLQFVWDTFKKEQGYALIHNNGNVQKTFVSWLQGLPSCFHIDYMNYRILEITKEWGSLPVSNEGLSPKAIERAKERILENWWNFIYMKFSGLCRKHKIKLV